MRLKAYLTTSKERREEGEGGMRKGRREEGAEGEEGGREIFYCKTLISLKYVHPIVCNYELN